MPGGQGQGSGLTLRAVGAQVGQESVTMTVAQMPPHEHPVSLGGTSGAASGAAVTGPTGGGQPIPTMPPSLILNYQIALNGMYPMRP